MDAHWEDEDWCAVLAEYAERDRAAEPVHPTIHLGPADYRAAIDAGFRPEDLTQMTAYVDRELPRRYWEVYDQQLVELVEGDMTGEPLGVLGAIGQEMELTRDGAGGSYVQISGNPGNARYDGPASWEPQQQNDMRPRVVNRAKVKAARKIARINRRKRGKH
jgi:hypothetical protein